MRIYAVSWCDCGMSYRGWFPSRRLASKRHAELKRAERAEDIEQVFDVTPWDVPGGKAGLLRFLNAVCGVD